MCNIIIQLIATMTSIFEVELPTIDESNELDASNVRIDRNDSLYLSEPDTDNTDSSDEDDTDDSSDDMKLVKGKRGTRKFCATCDRSISVHSKLDECSTCLEFKAKIEQQKRKNAARQAKSNRTNQTNLSPKHKRLTKAERDEIANSYVSNLCKCCSKEIESCRLDHGLDECTQCSLKNTGILCYNCGEKKFTYDFDSRKSVMCDDCFDHKPNWKWEDLVRAVSKIMYASKHFEIQAEYDAKILQIDKKTDKQRAVVEKIQSKKDALRQSLKDTRRKYNMLGVVIDEDVDDDEFDRLAADFNPKQDPSLIPGLTTEYKHKKQCIIRSVRSTSNEFNEQNRKLSAIQTERTEALQTYQEDLAPFTATDDQVEDLYNLIVCGEHTLEETLDIFFKMHDIKIKNKSYNLVLLQNMINNHNIVSEGLHDLEKEIRAGQDKQISDLIISVDPLKAWFNKTIKFDESEKARFGDVYGSFEDFISLRKLKPMSKKAFSNKITELCEDKPGFKKYKSGGFDWFRGIYID